MTKQQKKYYSKEEALALLQRYCAYRDRCHQEVRSKLLDMGIYGAELEEIVVELISENFLNEERFARSYARGKFRIKRWGRNRIRQELRKRQISDYCLRKAMEEIEEEEYHRVLKELLEKKAARTTAPTEYQRRSKTALYAINRGFEAPLVWETLRTVLKD